MADKFNIEINLDAVDFTKDLKLSQKAIDEVMKKITAQAKGMGPEFRKAAEESNKAGDQMKQTFTGAFAAIAAAAGTVTVAMNYMKSAISEAANAQESVAKLNNVLKLTGTYSDEASKGIIAFATALEQNSNFSAEAVQDQISLAIQMGKTSDEAKFLVQSAANLSTAMGQDLGSSMTQLLGSLNGIAPRFAKMSPDLKNMSESALKAGGMVNYFHDKAVNAAESTKTWNGQVQQLDNRMGDFKEAIGGALLEGGALQALVGSLASGFASAAEFIEENSTAVKVIAGALAGVAVVIAGIGAMAAAPFIATASGVSIATAAITAGIAAITGGTAAYFLGAEKEASTYQDKIDELTKAEEDLLFAQRRRNEYNKSNLDPSIAQSKEKIALLKEEIALEKKKADQQNPVMMNYMKSSADSFDLNQDVGSLFAMTDNMTGANKNENYGQSVIDAKRTVAPKEPKKSGGSTTEKAPGWELEQLRNSQGEYEALMKSRQDLQLQVQTEMAASKAEFYMQASEEDRANREIFTAEEAAANDAWLENFTTQDAIRLQAMAASVAAEGDMEKQKTLQAQYETEVRIGLKKKETETEEQMSKLRTATLNQALSTGLSLAKKGSREHKNLMRAQILMSTYTAATQALSAPPGAPWTIPIAALIVAQGLGNLKKVDEQNFAGGGIFNAGGTSINGDSRTARINDREMILNMQQQANLFKQINGQGIGGNIDVLVDIKNAIQNQRTNTFLDGIKISDGLDRLNSRLLT